MSPSAVALITGGSGGLGGALVRRLSEAGYHVAVHYFQNRRGAEDLCREISQKKPKSFAIGADLRSSGQADHLVAEVHRRTGRIDLLLNTVGITRDRLMARLSESDWDEVIATNLSGPFHTLRAAGRYMAPRRMGHIINIGSIAAKIGRAGQANYTAAKAGLIGLSLSAARELAPYNIRVNLILPGLLPTGAFRALSPNRQEERRQENLLNRIHEPEEVASFVIQLDSMKNVSGQIYNLDSRIAP